jgi:hypothetical protein
VHWDTVTLTSEEDTPIARAKSVMTLVREAGVGRRKGVLGG